MKISATRRIQFCAGHRVFEHGSKCRNLHGHNYVVFITAEVSVIPLFVPTREIPTEALWKETTGAGLNKLGMVIDFGVIKEKVGGWIDRNWDHGFIVYDEDKAAQAALTTFEDKEAATSPADFAFTQKICGLPYNPTAENIARYLLEISNTSLLVGTGVRVTKIVLWETENCFATVTSK